MFPTASRRSSQGTATSGKKKAVAQENELHAKDVGAKKVSEM
jgi:hypothetical protein